MRHRVLTNYFAESDGVSTDDILTQLVESLIGSGQQAKAG